jgi:hypothetical protein
MQDKHLKIETNLKFSDPCLALTSLQPLALPLMFALRTLKGRIYILN